MIRLTFITLGCMFAAMLVWGTEPGDQPTAALGQPDAVEPAETLVEETVVERVAEPAADPAVEVTEVAEIVQTEPLIEDAVGVITEVAKLETLDLTSPARPSNLIIVQSADAPPGEPLLHPLAAVVTEDSTTADTVASASPTIFAVNANSVNLRSGPSTSVSIVGNLKRGERAELVAEAVDGWLQIREISTGQIGYMASRFLDPVLQ